MSVALESAEREKMKDEKMAMAIELAASRSDKELISALHHRIIFEEEKRQTSVEIIKEVVGTMYTGITYWCVLPFEVTCCYNFSLRIIPLIFYQVSYIIFLDVHTSYLCYWGKQCCSHYKAIATC